MSKLNERIRRLGQTESAPMGFLRVTNTKHSAGLLLLARADTASVEAVDAGADGLIFGLVPATPPDGWWGAYAGSSKAEGADFLVAGPGTPLETLAEDGPSLVIEVDESWLDTQLRAVELFSPDAIYLRQADNSVTMERLLTIRRISGLAGPVILELQSAPDAKELRLMRDAGVVALVLPASDKTALGTLRQLIDALPPRKRKRDDQHSDAVVPQLRPVATDGDDEDDD